MYDGYLSFAGTELINNLRVSTYATALAITNVTCAPCEGLARSLYELPYSSPDLDDAPWFDPAVPESKEFAGFLGLEITGLSRSFAARGLVPLTERGASLHPLRRTHREVQVRALGIAKTQAALSYGMSWLASALRGNGCTGGCAGDQLCFFTTCPPCPPLPEDPEAVDPCGDLATQYWRQLYNVGLLAMEEPTDVRKVAGGWLGQVTFTVAAGDPFIYRDPVLMAIGPQPDQILPDYSDPGVPVDCAETSDCLRDGTCPPPPAPVLPPIPVDICYPTGPFTAGRVVLPLPDGRVPAWAEKVPLILIRSGSTKLERLTIRWYGNPTERECTADFLDPCAACAEVNIAFIPANSTLTIDGRREIASVDCPGGPGLITAEPALYGRGGTPFVWPVFGCGDGMCLEVIAKSGTVAADASIEIFYVVREDAA